MKSIVKGGKMDQQDLSQEAQAVSRRRFFGKAGTFLAGAAITAAGCSSLITKKEPEIVQAPVTWPYPYAKLDPEDVRIRAYQGYYKAQ